MKGDVKKHTAKKRKMNSRGQIAVEYILLLAIGVTIWLLLVNQLVNRDPNNPGVIVSKWYEIISFIGQDKIESEQQP